MIVNQKGIVIYILLLCLITSGCGPGQIFGPTITPTPTFTPTLTFTPTPSPTSTPIPPTPTFTNTPTPTPGPELFAYLPTIADLPQCVIVNYTVVLESSTLSCYLPGSIDLNAVIRIQENSFTHADLFTYADLKIYLPFAWIDIPKIGQGSIAGEVVYEGKGIALVFYKGNTMIRVDVSNPNGKTDPNGKANIDFVVELAQQIEKLIPDQIVPPVTLSFPDQLNQEAFKKYFVRLDIGIIGPGMRKQLNYTEDSVIVIKDNPKTLSRGLYVVGLYDVQKQRIMKKVYFEMIGIPEVFDATPRLWQGEYNVGDKYELRIALEDTLVAVYPFETK